MKIAICDDEQLYIDSLRHEVEACTKGLPVVIQTFLSGQQLLEQLAAGENYQIYFLDIELKDKNGMELAARIRESSRDAVIIFVTMYGEYMQRAFDVQAFQFIVKPFEREQVRRIIRNAIQYVNEINTCFTYEKQKQIFAIRNEEILYFESQKRKICVHTQNGEHIFYGTMEHIRKNANPLLFVQIHKSFIVNMAMVKNFHGNALFLMDGTELVVSRNYVKQFNEVYRNFLKSRIL